MMEKKYIKFLETINRYSMYMVTINFELKGNKIFAENGYTNGNFKIEFIRAIFESHGYMIFRPGFY